MNILIDYNEGGLGDTLTILPFAKDFHDQYPEHNLFITYKRYANYYIQRDQLWINNPDIKLYTNEKIDKIFLFHLENIMSDMESETILSRIYNEFNKQFDFSVKQNTFCIPWYFTDEELKVKLEHSKPICIINSGYHINVNAKNYGFDNYQKIINALQDKLLFIQIGETKLNGFQHNLHQNVVDLRDKLNLRTLAALLYYSNFVLTNVSSLNLFSGIPSISHRYIFTFCGNREPKNFTNIFSASFLHQYILQSNNIYDCFNHKYCNIFNVLDCKYKETCGNETICKCLNDIDPNTIINNINSILNKEI